MKKKKELAGASENLPGVKKIQERFWQINPRQKKAFTLAEVLITLVIIGVIGALTVPALIQNTQKKEYVSALKKAYSTLSQVTQQIITEESSPKCTDGGWACAKGTHFYEYYKKHLNVIKDCGTGAGCFPQKGAPDGKGTYKYLNGGSSMNWEAFNSHLYQAMVLSDGMQMLPVHVTDDCSREGRGTKGICASISVDVNGEKAPNQIGRDVFIFALKETGLYPQGCDSDYCVGTEGYGCACKVLNEGAMNY